MPLAEENPALHKRLILLWTYVKAYLLDIVFSDLKEKTTSIGIGSVEQ